MLREQLQTLEGAKQEKWDAIRALWAGDGGWHKRNGARPLRRTRTDATQPARRRDAEQSWRQLTFETANHRST